MTHFKVGTFLTSPKCGCVVRNQFLKLQTIRPFSNIAVKESTGNAFTNPNWSNDPTKHCLEDYLKFCTIEKKFIQNTLSDVVPRKFKEISRALGEYSVMLRKPSLEIIEQLENQDSSQPIKYLLYGPRGSGKSMSLLHVLYYASMKDWQILHIPDGFRFVDSQGSTEVQASQWRPGRFDQPKESLIWLNNFRQLNLKFLQQHTTTSEYKWGKRESTSKGCPLIDVVDQGIGRTLYGTDAVGVILKEIRANSESKVLFTVDGFNGLFSNSSHKVDGKSVERSHLSLVHHFTKLLSPEYNLGKNSAYVFAFSESGQHLQKSNVSNCYDIEMKNRLLETIGDCTELEVPNLNENEFEAIINFYKFKGWINRELTSNVMKELMFLTGKNPSNLIKYTSVI